MKSRYPIREALTTMAFAAIGLWLTVIRPIGPRWDMLPGGMGDGRLINYLLEHDYRWFTGADASFWNAPFFYPFPNTIAFSDNLLGAAPIYGLFRTAGLDRESALQGWYLVGYCLNFAAAIYVLRRLRYGMLARNVGAFFFAFGLPIMAQEWHTQLLYRVGVPLGCFFLWKMKESPRLHYVAVIAMYLVWQFYLSIYTGTFLAVVLFMLAVLMPLTAGVRTPNEILGFWPARGREAWHSAAARTRLLTILATGLLAAALAALLLPYWQVTRLYGFKREWDEIVMMLPTWRSYLVADRAQLWKPISQLMTGLPMREEHQLFPGIAAVVLAAIGLGWVVRGPRSTDRPLLLAHFWAGVLLVLLTLLIGGFSFYQFIWDLPGFNSIRAVTRVMLILMWPQTLFICAGVEALLKADRRLKTVRTGLAVLLIGLLAAESTLFDHKMYSKAEAQARLSALRAQVPTAVPERPILLLANLKREPLSIAEMDGMLLAQDLGWPTLNGDSGNTVPHFEAAASCSAAPSRIIAYMGFAGISSKDFYLNMIRRTVPVGFDDCDPGWWIRRPSTTTASGPLPQEVFANLGLRIIALKSIDGRTTAQLEIVNDSGERIPSRSASGNPFRLLWRLSADGDLQSWSEVEAGRDLVFDIRPHETALLGIELMPPSAAGDYFLEVAAVQQGIDSTYGPGVPTARSAQRLVVDAQGSVKITPDAVKQ